MLRMISATSPTSTTRPRVSRERLSPAVDARCSSCEQPVRSRRTCAIRSFVVHLDTWLCIRFDGLHRLQPMQTAGNLRARRLRHLAAGESSPLNSSSL